MFAKRDWEAVRPKSLVNCTHTSTRVFGVGCLLSLVTYASILLSSPEPEPEPEPVRTGLGRYLGTTVGSCRYAGTVICPSCLACVESWRVLQTLVELCSM